MITRKILFMAVALCMAIALTSCGRKRPPEELLEAPEADESAEDLAAGGGLYAQYCAPCHGTAGLGDGRYLASGLKPRPSDLTKRGPDALAPDQIASWIRDGSAAGGRSDLCPPWGKTLSQQEINQLADFVRQL